MASAFLLIALACRFLHLPFSKYCPLQCVFTHLPLDTPTSAVRMCASQQVSLPPTAVERDAMAQHPGTGLVSTTRAGWVVYWVTFGLMAASAVCFMVMKPHRHRKHGCEFRLHWPVATAILSCSWPCSLSTAQSSPDDDVADFHADCTALIVSVAGFAYYAMVSPRCGPLSLQVSIPGKKAYCSPGLSQASQGGSTYIYQIHGDNQRQIYWARYIDWVFTTPPAVAGPTVVGRMSNQHCFMVSSLNFSLLTVQATTQ